MKRKPNILDWIGKYIPGYVGYANRETRRQCDKVLRDHIARQLANCESTLQERISALIKVHDLQAAQDLEICRKRINTLSSKIKYAPYGESAFFSENQIKDDELDQLHECDKQILASVEDNMPRLPEMSTSDIQAFIATVLQCLDKRNQLLQEHK